MKIAFIWNFNKAKEIFPNWRDGHRAAIEEIAKKHQVDWYLGEDWRKVSNEYDFLLFWTDPQDSIIDNFFHYKGRKGLIVTTDLGLPGNVSKYNVVFCESQPVYEKVKFFAQRTIKAMGTDTDFFKPDPKIKKDIEHFYPATFSPWKKQSEIAFLGKDLLCVGTIQPDGREELEECKKRGVKIEIGYFPAKKIRDYYRRTKNILIPAIHGSERTVLEAMSMNILPWVSTRNKKAYSYIEEYEQSGCKSPREFILKNYSHKIYAKQLLKGIEK